MVQLVLSVLFVVWVYASMVGIAVLGLPIMAASPGGALWVIRVWAGGVRAGLWLIGLKVEFRGLENIPPGGVIIAAKHHCMLDTVAPFLVLPRPVYLMKQELKDTPPLGWYAIRANMVPVDREGHARALIDMVRKGSAAIKAGCQFVIFPEGTRVAPYAEPDYKPGVAGLYREAGAPCVPMATNAGLFWPAKGLRRNRGVIIYEFLPPIPPGLKRAEFMSELQNRIETATAALLPPRQV